MSRPGVITFVTGASRGFGRALSLAFASALAAVGHAPLTFVLFARDVPGLEETKRAMLEAHPDVHVITQALDFADVEAIEDGWKAAVAKIAAPAPGAPAPKAILINNAGSLGNVVPVRKMTSAASVACAVTTNITAPLWLSSLFLRYTAELEGDAAAAPASTSTSAGSGVESHSHTSGLEVGVRASTIINISSLCAIKAFATQSLYCTNKAARDMLHATIAAEEPSIRVLNYAPGPLDTLMQDELRGCETLDTTLRDAFIKMKDEGTLISPADSAAKCAQLVLHDTYVSGAHIDYYDL